MNKKNKTPKKTRVIETQEKLNIYDLKVSIDPSRVIEVIENNGLDSELGKPMESSSNVFKAMTLNEFQNGLLLSIAVPERYKTFAIDISRKLQNEHQADTVMERSLCEVITVNYIRVLEIQRKISDLFALDGLSKLDVHYLSILSKELDRAVRHYLTALQALREIKLPNLQMTIKTGTAFIAQNQFLESNDNRQINTSL